MAHVLAKDLRDAVLQAAIQGKLTKHYDTDTNVNETLKQVSREKKRLIMSKKIGKEKPFSKARKFSETPFDIPHTWEWVRFGNLMVNKDSYRIPISKAERAKKEKIFDYYGASGVIDKIDNYLFDEPNLLIGEDGANLLSRSTPIAFIATGKYWVNNHAHVLNTCAHVNLEYIQLYINAIDLSPYVSGTAQPKMNQENMNAIWVALPPIEEQQRIVDRVDELMTKIDEYEKLENQLVQLKEQFPKDMRDSLLQAAIQGKLTKQCVTDTPVNMVFNGVKKEKSTNPVKEDDMVFQLPDNWMCARLGEHISIKSGDGLTASKFIKGPYPVYGGNGITGFHNKSNTKKGTLLIGRVGFYCGSVHETIKDSWVTDNALIVSFDKYFIKNYLKILLTALNLGKSTNQTAQPVVTGKIIKPKVIAIPPIEEQQRIVDKLEKMLPLVDALAQMD